MGFLNSLLGGENLAISVFLALVAVLVLIVLAVWVLKFVLNATGNVARGRARRLGVVEATPIDQKHQLVLVRRDDVEHLLLVGGATDLLIESGIPAAQVTRPAPRPFATASQPADPAPARKPALSFTPIRRQRAATPAPAKVDTPAPVVTPEPVAAKPVPAAEPAPSGAPVVAPAPAPRDTTFEDLAKKAGALPFSAAPSGSGEPVNPIERLRALAQQSAKPRPMSLRHTGLLRPTDEGQASPSDPDETIRAIKASVDRDENPASEAADSAKTSAEVEASLPRPDSASSVADDGTEYGTHAAAPGEVEPPKA